MSEATQFTLSTPDLVAVVGFEHESGQWLAEVEGLPGCLVYGPSQEEAMRRVHTLALQLIADRLQHGDTMERLATRVGAGATEFPLSRDVLAAVVLHAMIGHGTEAWHPPGMAADAYAMADELIAAGKEEAAPRD